MRRKKRFSSRHGLAARRDGALVREGAPETIRCGLLQILERDIGKRPSWMRDVVCGVLRVRPNPSNWSEYPNVWSEVEGLVHNAEWFMFYDIVEGVHDALGEDDANEFEQLMNILFVEESIGWQLVGGEVQMRGDDAYEDAIKAAVEGLDESGMPTAASELREAFGDLSKRPGPDLSGAVHHAMAAIEAVAREFTGDRKSTLGGIIKKHPDVFPRPLDDALAKMWGFACEQARHGTELRELAWEEAQLLVGVSSVLCSYLTQKRMKS